MKKKKKQEKEKPQTTILYHQPTAEKNSVNITQSQKLRLTFDLKHMLSAIFIFALSIAIYSNTLKNGFVYDDEYTVVDNTLINDLTNLTLLFDKENYFARSGEASYRPVVTFTYFIDYAIYDLKSWGYHLTNILLHALNGVILYVFLTLLFKELADNGRKLEGIRGTTCDIPLFVSILFVSHPILTEAVNAISYREDLLAFFFYISTLAIYLLVRPDEPTTDNRQPANYLLYAVSSILYLLALLSKEMALTLPLVICCYEWLYADKKISLRQILFNRYNIGYIAVTLVYVYLRFYYYFNLFIEKKEKWILIERLITLPWFLVRYLKLFLFPFSLSADYVFTPLWSPFSPIFIFLMAVISIFIIISMKKKEKGIVFGILFFLITLLPVSNIVPLDNPFAERYLYLPIVGLAIVIGTALKTQNLQATRNYLILIFVAVVSIYSFTVIKRNTTWKDGYLLWSDTIRKMPASFRAHNNLGTAYSRGGQLIEAIKEYKSALELEPDNSEEIHNNLGVVYARQGNLNEAIQEYMIALEIEPKHAKAHNNLGNAFARQNRLSEAINEYLKALKLKPDFAAAYNNLGVAYARIGRLDDAILAFKNVLKFKPDYPKAHSKLGRAYFEKGLIDQAIREYTIALQFDPSDTEAQSLLKDAYIRRGYQ